MNTMLCGLEDDRVRFEPDDDSTLRAKLVEDYADTLMKFCRELALADQININHDLYDGDFLPKLMTEIANWTGRSDDAAERMRNLHNLLANEFQKIAEREVSK